jgi:hypothetical protein
MMICGYTRVVTIRLMILCCITLSAAAQEKREQTFSVGPRSLITVTNNHGPISLGPSGNSQVVVTTISRANTVKLASEQHGNRIDLRSIASANISGGSLVEYTVLVPLEAFVRLESMNGLIHARGLRGDIVMETASGSIEVSGMADAHLHVKTLKGPVTLSSIRNCHLDVTSVTGDVSLRNVAESSVVVNSGGGRIMYDGDPGGMGDYRLTSHSGDLTITIPANASVQITERARNAESLAGSPDIGTESTATGKKSLLKPGISNASRFVLRSFRGKIHLRRP